GELLEGEALLVRVRLCSRVGRAERARERERLAEAEVDVAVAAAERAHEAQEPAEALRALAAAALLGGVAGDVLERAAGGSHRDQEDVLALAAPVGVHHVGEEAEARRHELTRARARPLDVPLEREALFDQVVDVVVEHELVDLVVLEAPPDEEDARATHERAHGEE